MTPLRETLAAPRDLQRRSPDWPLSFLLRLGTHPELMERLWGFAPDCAAAADGRPVLATPGGVVFGVAGGTHFLALRVPPGLAALAATIGARPCPDAGDAWMQFDPYAVARPRHVGDGDLAFFVEAARVAAASTGT